MIQRDVAETLRKVAELRRFCLKLPHLETPAERRRLERCEALATAPGAASPEDIDALAEGWTRWWRQGEAARILAMAARLPATLIAADRRLASLLAAARLTASETARGGADV